MKPKWPIAANSVIKRLREQLAISRWWSAAWKAKAKKYRRERFYYMNRAVDAETLAGEQTKELNSLRLWENLESGKINEYMNSEADATEQRVAELEEALRKARLELGIPQENYPAPIVEAWMIIDAALNKSK